MIDTHSHLYLPEFDADREEAINRVLQAGIDHIVMPNVGLDTIQPMRTLAQSYPDIMSMAMGLHPTEISDNWREDLSIIMEELDKNKYVAVGEIGMDLYWDKTFATQQMDAFDMQLSKAESAGLPVIIHCREALDPTLEVFQSHKNVKAVFHSFGGSTEDVERIRKVGDYYFGINGVVTFKNCHVRDALSAIGLERLMLETDAPYLAPVPHRGKRNETSFMTHTASHIAQTLDLPVETIDSATTKNAKSFFNI